MSETAGWHKEEWVCTGKVLASDKMVCWVFQQIGEDGSLGPERAFSAKNFKLVRAGAVYEVECNNETGSARPSTARFLRLWQHKEQAAVWQEATRVFDIEQQLRKKAKSETARNLMCELLEPLRRQYMKTNHLGRTILEVQVLRYLRTGRLED